MPAPDAKATSSRPPAAVYCASPPWATRCAWHVNAPMTRSTRSSSPGGSTAPTSAGGRSSRRNRKPGRRLEATGGTMNAVPVSDVHAYLTGLQASIVQALEQAGGETFRTDTWQRPEGGGGVSRLIEDGQLLERAGVLFSHVHGTRLPPSASAHRPELAGRSWQA